MAYQLILLLQEVSEAVCGIALPTEICEYILNEHGGKLRKGMLSPSAKAVQEAQKLTDYRPYPYSWGGEEVT